MSGDQRVSEQNRVLVAGASGTIGCAVVKELSDKGHRVTALLRPDSENPVELDGAFVVRGEMTDEAAMARVLSQHRYDTVISCIASRSGAAKDAEAVDYRLNHHLLNASRTAGAAHFILLSAICVQKPLLAFQRAKLRFEAELKASLIDHTIVHPTAFFKSLSGQVDRVLAGKPFLLFGDGELTRCKPISDADLARFIVNCVDDPAARGQTLAIGGPGPAITLKEQGELLFEAARLEPRYRSVPVAMFDVIIGAMAIGERFSDWIAEKAEYARIGRYYATESMLVFDAEKGEYSADATPDFGEDRLIDHYRALIAERRAQGFAK